MRIYSLLGDRSRLLPGLQAKMRLASKPGDLQMHRAGWSGAR
jgi:hypothetical protein